jgi:hypothetical protein
LEAGIQEFFKRTVDYGFIELTTAGTANQTLDLEEQSVSATTADGRPLHIWKQTGRMQIMVPRYSRLGESTIVVVIKGPRIPPNSPPATYTINWESVRPTTSGNERIYIARQSMITPPAPTSTLLVDDAGRTLPGVTIPPPQ